MPIRVGCKKLLDRKSKAHAEKKGIVRSIKKRKKKEKKKVLVKRSFSSNRGLIPAFSSLKHSINMNI